MGKKKHAKNNLAPVEDFSPVKNSVTPKNQNRHAGETSKSKKTKPAEDPAPVEDTAMQCSSEDKAPVEDLSPVKKSATPKKSKKRKHAEDPAMQCSSDEDVEITDSDSGAETETVAFKAKEEEEEEEEKKTVTKPHQFQKIWKEEEEIVVLQGMINFKKETGKSPKEDKEGFYRFVEESISCEVRSLKQLFDKIRRMKNKYLCIGKSFSSDHDLKCVELGKLVWGTDSLGKKPKERVINKKTMKKEMEEEDEEEVFENSCLIRAILCLGVKKEEYLRERWGTVSMKKRMRIEDTLKTLEIEEFRLVTRKSRVLYEAMDEMDKASST